MFDIEYVLNGVRGAPFIDIGKNIGLRNYKRCSTQAAEWGVPRQVDNCGRRIIPLAACKVAGHIKPRVAGILSIEQPCAGADHPLGTSVPGNAEPRREILLVRSDQPVAEAAVPCDFDRGLESKWETFVEVSRSLPHESWMAAHIRYVRGRIDERNLHVDQISRQVHEGRRVLVSHAVVDRHFRVDLPRVIEIIGLAHCPKLNLCKRCRSLVPFAEAEQEIGESVPCIGASKV